MLLLSRDCDRFYARGCGEKELGSIKDRIRRAKFRGEGGRGGGGEERARGTSIIFSFLEK